MADPKTPNLTGRPRLTWPEAVAAMLRGAYVRRAKDCYLKLVERPGDDGFDTAHPWAGAPVYESGQEGCYLAHAWTADEKPVQVFMGASSKCLFVPGDDDRAATDWVELEKTEC